MRPADPAIPPFSSRVDLRPQGEARRLLADHLEKSLKEIEPAVRTRWAKRPAQAVQLARQKLTQAEPFVQNLRSGPLDAELALTVQGPMPIMSVLAQQLGAIEAYLPVADKWYAVFCFARKSRAGKVAAQYGLPLNPQSAERLRAFLAALRARVVLQGLYHDLLADSPSPGTPGEGRGEGLRFPSDEVLAVFISQHQLLLDLLSKVHTDPALEGLAPLVAGALSDSPDSASLLDGLRKSPARAAALEQLERSLSSSTLFDAKWLATFTAKLRQGQTASTDIAALNDSLDTLEGVLRIRKGLTQLPPTLATTTSQLLSQSVETDVGINLLRKESLAAEIRRHLQADPHLQGIDGQRLGISFERYRELDAEKKTLLRDAILHQWITKQKDRLLAGTGSRLNGAGADLRRRLTMRGERAMRLRQVVAIGRDIEGGDPLFDLRPVWMASPETVAQVFPAPARLRRRHLRRSLPMPPGGSPPRAHPRRARRHRRRPQATAPDALLRIRHRRQRG